VRPRSGGGSIFRMSLPALAESEAAEQPEGATAEA
jgi:hypothetical protein